MKLQKGNVFTPVCHSFCSQGEVYTPLGRHPLGRHPLADTPWQTSVGRYPLTDTQTLPWQRRPPWQTTPGRHPPPRDSHCSGRYPSYWNAFLYSNGKHHLSHGLRVSCLWEICGVCGPKTTTANRCLSCSGIDMGIWFLFQLSLSEVYWFVWFVFV